MNAFKNVCIEGGLPSHPMFLLKNFLFFGHLFLCEAHIIQKNVLNFILPTFSGDAEEGFHETQHLGLRVARFIFIVSYMSLRFL